MAFADHYTLADFTSFVRDGSVENELTAQAKALSYFGELAATGRVSAFPAQANLDLEIAEIWTNLAAGSQDPLDFVLGDHFARIISQFATRAHTISHLSIDSEYATLCKCFDTGTVERMYTNGAFILRDRTTDQQVRFLLVDWKLVHI